MTSTQPARPAPPEDRIRALFDDVVDRYDVVNRILSLGLDRRWRRAAAAAVRGEPGSRVLDLGCGTGDLALILARRHRVTGIDVSRRMLTRAWQKGRGRIHLVQGSAFALPFGDGTFDGVASAFVLRNLAHLPKAFAEMARVLRPGGRVALLDILQPENALARRAFDGYFRVAAPALGRVVGKPEAYRYLVRSLVQLPNRQALCVLLEAAGLSRVSARPLSPGPVTLFEAIRPQDRG